jgi:hypothetical protein
MRRERWCRDHHGWMEIPYRDGKNHVWKGESSSFLDCLDSRLGVEERNLGDGLGDCLPNQDFLLEGRKIWDKWCSGEIMELLR